VATGKASFGCCSDLHLVAAPKYRVPLSGHIAFQPATGLEPWAALLDHFMVEKLACSTQTGSSNRFDPRPNQEEPSHDMK
jgi:hypothetical protein